MKGLTLAASLATILSAALPGGGMAQPAAASAGAPRGKATPPAPAAEPGPTAVEVLNRSLNPAGTSDPDVPLPHPDLANIGPPSPARGSGTRIYGRQEEGGGVLGLKMPIPVERAPGAPWTTRSGEGPAASPSMPQGR